jgi:hypothetical protein
MSPLRKVAAGGIVVLVALQGALLAWGLPYWRLDDAGRAEHPLNDVLHSGEAVGQMLGLAALACVVVLMTWSVRKLLVGASVGPTRLWLWVHVLAGSLAPILVLQHCGLRFEGMPGLAAMGLLFVFASGLLGRFLYLRLPDRAERCRRDAALPTAVVLRASAGTDSARPGAPNPAVTSAVAAVVGFPVGTCSALSLPVWEVRGWKASRSLRAALADGTIPEQIRAPIEFELRRALTARRSLRRWEAARRLLRRWRILHLSVSHATLVLIALHAGIALTWSGTFRRIRIFLETLL